MILWRAWFMWQGSQIPKYTSFSICSKDRGPRLCAFIPKPEKVSMQTGATVEAGPCSRHTANLRQVHGQENLERRMVTCLLGACRGTPILFTFVALSV
jgi:hypothetical protein